MKNNQNNQRDELDWQAFRYVAGELNESESEQFEARLDQDQDAREAVASAVDLVQTVSAAEHLRESPAVAAVARQAHWWRRVAWTSIAAGVCVCVALIVLVVEFSNQSGAPLADSHPAHSISTKVEAPLATAWLETLDESAFAVEPSAEDRVDLDAILSADNVAPVAAPDWMVSALAGMSNSELIPGTQVEREN